MALPAATFGDALSLIAHGNPYLVSLIWVTVRLAIISTAAAFVIGVPIGATLALGRFRGRRTLLVLANASIGLPPVAVGVVLLLFLVPQGPFGSLRIEFTLRGMYVAQTILALPYIVALTAAAIQGLPGGLLAQAHAFGAGRAQATVLALREARVGVMAAVIAAAGSAVSEVGAVIIVGGNVQSHDQTLAGALIAQFDGTADDPYVVAIVLLLAAMIVLLIGLLAALQQWGGGVRLRFRGA